MDKALKQVIWIGSSRKDISSFPSQAKRSIGQSLYAAQMGETDPAAKPLRGFRGVHVMEIVERYDSDTYRTVYITQLGNLIYVLHAFKKKSKRGIETPKKDIDLIKKRVNEAKEDYKRRQN
jgi:phage-related protein